MRWLCKPPKEGDTKIRKRFAFIPEVVRDCDRSETYIIWLETYLQPRSFKRMTDGCCYWFEWYTEGSWTKESLEYLNEKIDHGGNRGFFI